MNFLADENTPLPTVRKLRKHGYDVAAVAQESPGIADNDVLARAVQEQRILLTFDSDYGSLLYQQSSEGSAQMGVVYFRMVPSSPEEPADLLLALLDMPDVPFKGYLTVAERERVRQRPLPGSR